VVCNITRPLREIRAIEPIVEFVGPPDGVNARRVVVLATTPPNAGMQQHQHGHMAVPLMAMEVLGEHSHQADDDRGTTHHCGSRAHRQHGEDE